MRTEFRNQCGGRDLTHNPCFNAPSEYLLVQFDEPYLYGMCNSHREQMIRVCTKYEYQYMILNAEEANVVDIMES
jgi:MFS superfamily sulfate permease-like transporter